MLLHQTSGRWQFGLFLSSITLLLWGLLPLALKITLQVLDVYTVTWFRFFISYLILGFYLASNQQLPTLTKLRQASLSLVIIAIIFLGINYVGFLQGLALTSPSNAEVLIQLAPVLMGLGGLYIFKERYNVIQWSGLGLLIVGFILFSKDQLISLDSNSQQYLMGNAILIIAAIAWSIYALAQKQLLSKLPSSNIMWCIYGSCTILLTPIAQPEKIITLITTQPFPLIEITMLVFCALNTLIAYGAFSEALEHWEASRVSSILATAPIITMISVWLFSSIFPTVFEPDPFNLLGIIGAILVVIGSVAIALGKTKTAT